MTRKLIIPILISTTIVSGCTYFRKSDVSKTKNTPPSDINKTQLSDVKLESGIDGLYVKKFGDATKQAILFVHGGPGHNSHDFEVTTAEPLAAQGYHVVVYDQRGQGRSKETDSKNFNYRQYAHDIKSIIDAHQLKDPVILGHSHGGPISIKFDEFYPGIAKKIALIAAPVIFSDGLKSLYHNCSANYEAAGQKEYVSQVGQLYSSMYLSTKPVGNDLIERMFYTFSTARYCGAFKTKNPSDNATALKKRLADNPLAGPMSGAETAMPGFLANENYIEFDGSKHVHTHRARYCGIYGSEDGLFTPLSRAVISNILNASGEPERIQLVAGASHSIYVDQQADFFAALKSTCSL